MSFFFFTFFPQKTRASLTSKKKRKKDLGSPLLISTFVLPIMAPTVKRIMTQPIVSTHSVRSVGLSTTLRDPGIASFPLFLSLHIDGDLISLSPSLFNSQLSLAHKTEPDLPLPAVAADGADLVVRAGRPADRRAYYRECFSFVFLDFPPLSIRRRQRRRRQRFFFFRPPPSLSLLLSLSSRASLLPPLAHAINDDDDDENHSPLEKKKTLAGL